MVYFAANEEDIEPEDISYTDILLACTRHLVESLKESNPEPLLNWLREQWNSLNELATTPIEFESLAIEAQISQFAKLTANLRAVPSTRQKIRDLIDTQTVSLLKALNEFITESKHNSNQKLVILVDNLDRIVPIIRDEHSGNTNHDEIFIDRAEQMTKLVCHVVYTILISMIYSNKATQLESHYTSVDVLPMITVQQRGTRELNEYGVKTLKELIIKRIKKAVPDFSVATLIGEIFESEQVLNDLCIQSGGHIRNVMQLMKFSLKRSNNLPITSKALRRTVAEMGETYRRMIFESQWSMLAKVYLLQKIFDDEQYRKLLFNRCILCYR